jgi:hypothetical protein
MPSALPAPRMVRYAFRAGQTGCGFYRMPRTYPQWPPQDGEACEPFLGLSPKLAHADGKSIIPDLPTEDIIL